MSTFSTIVTSASIIVHSTLFAFALRRKQRFHDAWAWSAATLLLGLAASASYLMSDDIRFVNDKIGRGFIFAFLLMAMLVAFGAIVFYNIRRSLLKAWLALGIVWLVGLVAAAATSESVPIGENEWLINVFTSPDVVSIITLAGLAIAAFILLVTAFSGFYSAFLPEVANRALFWVINIAILVTAIILGLSGSEQLVLIGFPILAFGLIGSIYAQMSHRVFDIRGGLTLTAQTLVIMLLTMLFMLVALFISLNLELTNDGSGIAVIIAIALVASGLYIPIREIVEIIFRRMSGEPLTGVTQATRVYSQQVSKAVDIDQLVGIATQTLNQVMGVRNSGLIVVNSTDPDGKSDAIELFVMPGSGVPENIETHVLLNLASPIYHTLASERLALSQYDLEFAEQYQQADKQEREFFTNLQMGAYAPIVVEDTLIGILACGAKINDAPFTAQDLEILATMGDQTGIALRNARLFADLKHLNESMSNLNKGLEEANEQLAVLDSVKTDFITIASHELRTPLAQIRGYNDILDALNEQGLLDQDQIASMSNNLRKATERMEGLIAAMLDVSQLDVNAMDLNFTPTSPEAVVRMAIEPLTEAIKERKLSLSARGLRGLPQIDADLQRLVQAFGNLIVNAIKFTPDGGRVEITGSLQKATKPGEQDHVLIAIADTGVGIAPENLELIFEKFYRAYDPALHSTGTTKFLGAGPGLGLTIAKGVIEGHRGKVWVESLGHDMETYPGSTFYVLLPVSQPSDGRRVLQIDDGSHSSAPDEASLLRSEPSPGTLEEWP
ncbi:MAG: GAF domain-containing protein [Chloroflexi bacterium]|nr:MAG: GAF domain-containing protein [Chloroflexota bacterium]